MGSSTTSEYRSEQYEMTLSRAMYAPANDRRQQATPPHEHDTIRTGGCRGADALHERSADQRCSATEQREGGVVAHRHRRKPRACRTNLHHPRTQRGACASERYGHEQLTEDGGAAPKRMRSGVSAMDSNGSGTSHRGTHLAVPTPINRNAGMDTNKPYTAAHFMRRKWPTRSDIGPAPSMMKNSTNIMPALMPNEDSSGGSSCSS